MLSKNKRLSINSDIVQSLGRSLGIEVELMNRAIDYGKEQRLSLVNNDLEALQKVTKSQEELGIKMENEEKIRIKRFVEILGLQGLSFNEEQIQTVKCKDLYAYIDEESGEWFEGMIQSLKSSLSKVKALNNINEVLIKNSQDITLNTFEIVTGSRKREAKKVRTYGNGGLLKKSNKMQVNLINQKG